MIDEMANTENLVPNSARTPSERRENARRAGIASGVARRAKKTMGALLELAFEKIITNDKGKTGNGKDLTAAELVLKCANGDLEAIKLAAKLLGEYSDRHELTGADGQPLALQAAPPPKLTADEMRVALEELREDL